VSEYPVHLEVTSAQNPGVKHVVKLRDRRHRDRSGEFLIEGYPELLRALAGGVAPIDLYICPELFLGSNEPALIAQAVDRGARIIACSEPVFRKISYRDRPDGLLATAKHHGASLSALEGIQDPLLVLAESIEKPGNLGTILRSSDAVGADGLIVCDRCTDSYNPNVVRASTGTLFTLPVIEAEGEETLQWLRAHGVRIAAATPSAEAVYTEVDLTGPLVIAVGTEQLGLSERWMSQADIQVRIPMCGVADSLNVAMATTLMLYEALRQRS